MHLYFSFKDIIKTHEGKAIHSKPWGCIDFKVIKLTLTASFQTATMVALLTKEKVIFFSFLKRLFLQRPYWWEGRRKPDIILDSSQPTFRHLFLLLLSWRQSSLSVTILKIWSLWAIMNFCPQSESLHKSYKWEDSEELSIFCCFEVVSLTLKVILWGGESHITFYKG